MSDPKEFRATLSQSRKEKAKGAADAWKRQYFDENDNRWGSTISGPADKTYQKILACYGNADKIDAVLGTEGWTKDWCHCCSEYKTPTVDVGYRDSSATVCADCVGKISTLLARAR